MKIVYIAGPYGDAGGYLAIDRNIANARDAANWLVINGIGFLCPHMNSAHFEAIRPEVPVEFWYEMDIRLMAICDAMLIIEGSDNSRGVAREAVEFAKTGRPIFQQDQFGGRADLLEWAKS